MDDLGQMTLSDFKLWSIQALRVFLSLRKRSIEGNFDELAARAFCISEENLPVDEQAEQAEQRLLKEYKDKLVIGSDVVPDPASLTTGWKGEKSALCKWPSVYITDISEYLNCSAPGEIMKRLLNEYKEGKAYRYFESGWVKEVFIHNISENSDKCLMKAKVTPSMAINRKYYDVWVVLEKDMPGRPGGKVLSSYCSCTAGMLGSCNHVAGLLFRVEHAVKTGETKLSKTSKLSTWNIPKGKPVMTALKSVDVNWTKGRYGKTENNVEVKQKRDLKSNFTPLSKAQKEQVQNQDKVRSDLYSLLKKDIPNSCFTLMKEKRRMPLKTVNAPDSLVEIMKQLRSTGDTSSQTVVKSLEINRDQQDSLNQATVQQAYSDTWHEQRKGRITASNFQRVVSRVNTLRKDSSADPSALVQTILGEKRVKPTMAMKHGTSLEPAAKHEYTKVMKKQHKKFKTCNSGLTIFIEKPFIAASADLEVECDCCGKGLCEIKCPESLKDQVPTQENVPYVFRENGTLKLDKRHPYFFQIQGQMRILEREYCDLFVFTFHGNLRIRLKFDAAFWERAEESLTWFWMSYVMPELLFDSERENKTPLTNQIATETQAKTPLRIIQSDAETPVKNSPVANANRALFPIVQQPVEQPRKRQKQSANC